MTYYCQNCITSLEVTYGAYFTRSLVSDISLTLDLPRSVSGSCLDLAVVFLDCIIT